MGALSLQFTGDLIPNLVDKRATLTPDAIYAEYPVSVRTYDQGYRKITYREFANAVNGAATWLVDTLGPGKDFETLAYIGPNDIRYPALILGAVKAGYKLFLTSPRNSIVAQFNLFERLACKTLLSPGPRPDPVIRIVEHHPFNVIEVPDVTFFLDDHHEHFPYHKSWPQVHSEPLFVVHTSGSTGMPKPITYNHATAAANIKMLSLDPPTGYDSQDRVYHGKRVFVAFPPFHGAYLVLHFFSAVPFGTIIVSPTSGGILTGDGLVESMTQNPVDIAFIVPSVVHDLALELRLLAYCAEHLRAIIYCGGDLPQAMGDTIAGSVRLLNQFGASELGLTPNILSLGHRGPEDWKYVQFHPQLGLELRHIANGTHELYAIRDPSKVDTQPTFTIFPHAQEYASRDLFVRHPSRDKLDLWSWQARADDIIVFLNGEKTNPISMEQHIVARNSDISAALVLGAQRFQAALLLEPINQNLSRKSEVAAFIEKVWPTVEEANKSAPSHARIMKSHVMFTLPHKPMLRAGKGTVQRSGTLKTYESEIDALYRDADTMSAGIEGQDVALKGVLSPESIATCVRQSVLCTLEQQELGENADFVTLGMNSLQVLVLVRDLRRNLGMSSIAPSTVYTNPSVSALATAIRHLSDQDQFSKASNSAARAKERASILQECKSSIASRLSSRASTKPTELPRQTQEIVVLTGSTGALGSYILDMLIKHDSISHVYCLNRKIDSKSVQGKKSRLLGLDTSFEERRVTFLTADLCKEYFNMGETQYGELLSKTTLIIHNAWTVDFNLSLISFKPQLSGLCRILEFANDCTHPARFLYMSSISSVMSYHPASGKVPEDLVTADTAPGLNGYAESKYIAEQIIDYAAQRSPPDRSFAFARVGQVAGAAHHSGMWNKAEWFPSMIISSLHIGALPDSLGATFDLIDWVPSDLLASIIVELALTRPKSATDENAPKSLHVDVYHPRNPHAIPWTALKPTIVSELSLRANKPTEVIPLRAWIAKVRKEADSAVDRGGDSNNAELEVAVRMNPAAKLLEFYEELAAKESAFTSQLELSKTLTLSPTMQALELIKDEWVRKWISEWFTS